jgi:hypothetical protein
VTPEGKIKTKVKKVLQEFGCWNYWPVPSGYGRRTVDALCLSNRRFFAIEVKRPGAKPTKNQEQELYNIKACGGTTFVIDCDEGINDLRTWLEGLHDTH